MEARIKQLQIENLTCDCVDTGSYHTCYLLVPMILAGRQIAMLAEKYSCNIVAIHGIDWDNALTPWPAPGVFPGEPDFEGKADKFLFSLKEEVIPKVERLPGMESSAERTLIGVSLSGLFALWAWMQEEYFANIGSISGSFWYDGFVEWIGDKAICPKSGYAYFSLGDKEGNSRDISRFRTIQQNTAQVYNTLRQNGIRTIFEQTSGTHFAPFIPRLEKALKAFAYLSTENRNT